MNTVKRFLAALLCVCMAAALLPATARAGTATEAVGATFSIGNANEPERRYDYLILSQNPNEVALVGCVRDPSVTQPNSFKIEGSVTHPDSGNDYRVVGIGKLGKAVSLNSAVDYQMNLVIPDSVRYIGKEVFMGAPMKSVTFGAGLKEIGASAFQFCLSLETIDFSKAAALEKIGAGAFAAVYGLKGPVVLPDSVKEFGSKPFTGINLAGYLSIPKGATLTADPIFVATHNNPDGVSGTVVVNVPDITLNAGDAATGRDPYGFTSHTVFKSPQQLSESIPEPAMNALGISMDFSGFDGSTVPGVYSIPLSGKGNTTCPGGKTDNTTEIAKIFKEYSIVVRRGTVTVNPVPPTVTVTPATQTVDAGGSATITATVPARDKAALHGNYYTMQWQKLNGTVWEDVGSPVAKPNDAEAVATYTLSNVTAADDGARFRCKVGDAYGAATSAGAALSVSGAAPAYDPTYYYTLTFNTNGGGELPALTREEHTTIDLTKYTPVREGCAFTGWYADRELRDKIESLSLTKNTAVYAGWRRLSPFSDVSEGDWFCKDVERIFALGLMQGTGDAAFSPYAATTRGMIATILWRLEGEPAAADAKPFDDVAGGKYYSSAVIWAAASKIVEGYGDGRYGPEDNITREQLAAILWRYAKYKGCDTTQGGMAIREFTDYESISPYAMAAVAWAVNTGLIRGSGGELMPAYSATRAQVAAILNRFLESAVK